MEKQFIIALGSNLGTPENNLLQAIKRLQMDLDQNLRHSSLWLSEPQGPMKDAGTFLNAVVVGQTNLDAHELLTLTQAIEVEMGRPPDHRSHESRTIDLDIIALADLVLDEPKLCIPHRHAHERLFVLQPLAELLPELVLPGQKLNILQLIDLAPPMEISRQPQPPF